MREQGTAPPPTPLTHGGPTPVGDLPSARLNFSFSPPLSKGTPISETLSVAVGGPVCVDGTLPKRRGTRRRGKGTRSFDIGSLQISERDRERLAGFIAISDTGLSIEQTFFAQILWTLHWMGRSPGFKPLSEWTIEEIINFARGSAPGVSHEA